MTWLKIDDGWSRHAKTRAAGKDGRALWTVAAVECAANRSDGHVPAHLVKDYAYFAEVPAKKASELLIASGLWHDRKTIIDCDSCARFADKLSPGDFYFHDWTDWQPTRGETAIPTERLRWRRRKALHRNPALLEKIVARDRDLCRYCGVRVNFADHRSPTGGTYDHIDPAGENTLKNIVVACRKCNGEKRDRTPEEAGMTLLPVPPPYQPGSIPDSTRVGTGTNPDSFQTESGSDPDPNQTESRTSPDSTPRPRARKTGRVGTGRKRNESGSNPGRNGTGPGSAPGPVHPSAAAVVQAYVDEHKDAGFAYPSERMRKAMGQIAKQLLEQDFNSDELIRAAKECARKRRHPQHLELVLQDVRAQSGALKQVDNDQHERALRAAANLAATRAPLPDIDAAAFEHELRYQFRANPNEEAIAHGIAEFARLRDAK